MMSLKYLTLVILCTLALSSYIEPSLMSYDEALSQELVYYSFASYCSTASITSWTIPIVSTKFQAWEDIKVVETSSLSVMTGYNYKRNAITFAFRGTSNLANWIANINAVKSNFGPCNCQVHAGFLSNYNTLKNAGLLSQYQLLRAKHPHAQLHVTGHSLGGALATLFVGELHSIGVKADVLITFGSPRVGDQNFYPWFQNFVVSQGLKYFRITHGNDPVPHLPVSTWGFYHIESEIFYNEAPIVCKEGFGEDPNCSFGQSYSIFVTSKHGNYVYVDSSSVNSKC